jgi:hypothetical protein
MKTPKNINLIQRKKLKKKSNFFKNTKTNNFTDNTLDAGRKLLFRTK